MNQELLDSLESVVTRVNTDRVERKLNSHDIAAMPILIKPLLGNTLADAVVQPQSEAELVRLVQWANQHHVPLTPRGKATSGYGGVLPIKQGIVVDFYFLRDVLKIDRENLTVTTQSGISFEHLDKAIKKKGLTLRLYPSSYPSATVGGWLAQGGSGFGSYQYGSFADNVVSAKVVQPDGEVRTFAGEDLGMIADAEGITGLISEVTLRVMPDEELDLISVGCDKHACFQRFLGELINADLPVWSLMFINPKMAELKNEAPQQMHYGHPVQEHVELPKSYIITITSRKKDAEHVRKGVESILEELRSKGEQHVHILSQKIAEHEWENRFKLMVVKRLGPSLVPAEVIVPADQVGNFLAEVESKIGQPIVKEGVVLRNGRAGKPEVVILGFIPADQRKLSYNFAFALSLTVAKLAEKFGGREYSTGLYFTKKANHVLGKDRADRLRSYKKEVDPNGILNPGKVIGNGLVGNFLQLASAVEPVARLFGNAIKTEIGERPTEDVRDIPADIVWYAYSCSQCGYCVDECDQFYGRGWESESPRGKWYWLREYAEGRENWDQKMVDKFLVCTTCELCNNRCSAALPIEPSWMKLRGKLVHEEKRMTIPPFEMLKESLVAEGDIWAGYRKNRDAWFPEDLVEKHYKKEKTEAVYFAGCTASFVENDIAIGSVRLLDAAGVDFGYLGKAENCCAIPMLVAGKWDTFVDTMKKNIAAVKAKGASTVITSCPACDMMWRHAYQTWTEKLGIEYGIKSKHYSQAVSEQIAAGKFQFPENNLPKQTVTWHDSCHMGRVSGIYEPPRDLIKAIPNIELVEMDHNRAEAHCCGSVLTLIKDPSIAAEIGKTRLDEAEITGASTVLAACPCCEFQLRVSADKEQSPMQVEDLSSFASKMLGFELPDPHPEVRAQWAVFEAMIALMTPEGFAQLMGTMWPELIDAMPMGMGGMMRFMGKSMPWSLGLMKPMFPVLFPILLPKMMPKVMSTMLDRVGAMIPMPDYMAEQMPELMPKVMDSLMPHMIGDVVPLVTDPMLDYLKGKTNGKH